MIECQVGPHIKEPRVIIDGLYDSVKRPAEKRMTITHTTHHVYCQKCLDYYMNMYKDRTDISIAIEDIKQ